MFIQLIFIFNADYLFIHFPQLVARYSNVCGICLTLVDNDAIDSYLGLTASPIVAR